DDTEDDPGQRFASIFIIEPHKLAKCLCAFNYFAEAAAASSRRTSASLCFKVKPSPPRCASVLSSQNWLSSSASNSSAEKPASRPSRHASLARFTARRQVLA